MKYKNLSSHINNSVTSVRDSNERLETNVVKEPQTSVFDISFSTTTTLDSAKVVPVFFKEVLPGDYWRIKFSTLVRQSTPSAATMESANYNIDWFFVSNIHIWPEFKYFMGENKNAGYQKDYKTVPVINFDQTLKYDQDDLASYLGIPQNVDMSKTGLSITSLPFKAFIKIYNEWYRNENLQSEIDNTNNSNNSANINVSDYIGQDINLSLQIGKGLPSACKLSDYFTTALPWPQKGDAVSINNLPLNNLFIQNTQHPNELNLFSPHWYNSDGSAVTPSALGTTNKGTQGWVTSPAGYGDGQQKNLSLSIGLKENTPLYTVNDLRLSIAYQHMLELDARGGTRYNEILLNHFGVSVNNLEIDRSEYIGGIKGNTNMSNIVQSSAGNTTSPLGVLGGVSVTDNIGSVEYAVKTHGYIFGIITIRPTIKYSQGLEKVWTRTERLDYYDSTFANIGEQPILKHEIYLSENKETNLSTFGFNEPWADYRYSLSKLTGYLSVNNPLSLAVLYSYTEKYTQAPTLGDTWIKSDKSVIGDTLLLGGTDKSSTEYIHQFLADFYFHCIVDRRMPAFGIPGIDKI